MKRISGLWEPTADSTPQVMKANVFHARCFADPPPGLVYVDEVRPLVATRKDVRIVLVTRDCIQ